MSRTAIIIGAGPAGLTAAYELVTKTDIKPIILERSNEIGGLSRTVVHNGNRMDIGGHRFFSKSERVMNWWTNILPVQGQLAKDESLKETKLGVKANHGKLTEDGPDPERTDKVMLIRSRLSRIFFLRKFFDYPISINWRTIKGLGFSRLLKIGFTYLKVKIKPIKNVNSLEDFFISRFGTELYETFFKDYTAKVWGVPCSEIAADWGAQRIKGLSITKAVLHSLKSVFVKDNSIEQKSTETSLIDQFMYPKYGPGQMWETVAEIVKDKGGSIIMDATVSEIQFFANEIVNVAYSSDSNQKKQRIEGSFFISTMPIKELIKGLGNKVPKNVQEVGAGLQYRDFITVGLLLKELKAKNKSKNPTLNELIPDNWIYIQENDVKLGRLQIFNNWSPYMVSDLDKVWLGLEYFCNEGDELWEMSEAEFLDFAIEELNKIGLIDKQDVMDGTVIKAPKTYPAYFGTYSRFHEIREYLDGFKNLFLIGRNGMHKYNNQDHSMLTAMLTVENIISGKTSKENIWNINTEESYHEEK